MTKYEPIGEALRSLPCSRWRASFEDLEEILGFGLPRSAKKHRAWWANNPSNHSHSKAWLDAGWETEQVDMANQKLTFRRSKGEPSAPPSKDDRPSIFGCLKGTVHVPPGVDLTEPTGVVWNAQEGKLYE